MDKLVGELLQPFAKRFAASNFGAVLIFWVFGLLLFHWFHPQPFPGCSTGGADLCGLFSGQWPRIGPAILCLALAVTSSWVLLFSSSRAAATAQFLSGCHWHRMRGPGTLVQHRARNRALLREHGDWKADSPPRPIVPGGRSRSGRYPQDSPRKPHDDPLPTDVLLEPTFLGNVFAASRQRILHKDGLHLQRCWHVLLIVLPQEHRARLELTSAALLSRAQAVTWSVVSMVWAVWLPGWTWAPWLLGCLVAAYGGYRAMCAAAGSYCDQMEAIVSVHRSLLYEKLGLPPVELTPDEQRRRQEYFGIGIKGPYSLPVRGPLAWPSVPETDTKDSHRLSTSVTAVLARGHDLGVVGDEE